MKLTYYGQSCFGIATEGHQLLIDPFITSNEKAKGLVDVDKIPADFILITHAHFDHVEDVERIARRTHAQIVAVAEITQYYTAKGFQNLLGMNTGGTLQMPFGRLKVVSAIHSSSFPDGTYGGNPVGLVIEAGKKTIYHSGDTALTLDMQMIARRFMLDAAMLCIGGHYTMSYQEAAVAAEFVGCNKVIGMHYDTYPVLEIDHQAAIDYFKSKSLELVLMPIGSQYQL